MPGSAQESQELQEAPNLLPKITYRYIIAKDQYNNGLLGPSPGIDRAPIARIKMILIPIESLYKNLLF